MTFLIIFRFLLLNQGLNRLSIEINILPFAPKTKFKSEIEIDPIEIDYHTGDYVPTLLENRL